MGFDNECIVNIQSLAGEYFCPVCRLLVYPNEALQSQCTHLYCKPCLTYIVSTTRACPYDGYLVTEADSKPLTESNKALAETIGKIAVHCLYHRSGCTWQGTLSECTSHCSGCAFGNSPVVCNRCGIQIVHCQVQEHAQNCPGVQSQVQPTQDPSATSAVPSTDQNRTAAPVGAMASQALTSQTVVTTTPGQVSNQLPNPDSQTQPLVQTSVQPTAEQWYQQQQFQQYYQQYPGQDSYQQQYQHYYPYQQSAVPQYQQTYGQPQPQSQSQTQVQPQSQPQAQQQSQPQLQPQPQAQGLSQPPLHIQAPLAPKSHNQMQVHQQQPQPIARPHSQVQSLSHPPGHAQALPQPQPQPYPYSYPQVQAHAVQPQPQQHMQVSPYQQPHSQMQHSQPQIQQPVQKYPAPQPQVQPQLLPHVPVQHISQPQMHHHQPLTPNAQPQVQNAASHAVTGHHSYPQPQAHQNMQLGVPQHAMQMHPQSGAQPQAQHPVQMPNQFPQQMPMMRPPHQSPAMFPNQQQPALLPSPVQGQSTHPLQHQPVYAHSQQSGQINRPILQPAQQILPHQPFAQHQMPMPSHIRSQGPAQSVSRHVYPQSQGNAAVLNSTQHSQAQNAVGRSLIPNHAGQVQPFAQSANNIPVRPGQIGASQLSENQNLSVGTNNQVQLSSELQARAPEPTERQGDVIEQQTDPASGKPGKNFKDLDTVSGSANELKSEKVETDMKPLEVGNKQNGEDQQYVKIIGPNASALENGDSGNKNLVKGEATEAQVDSNKYSVVKGNESRPLLKSETKLSESETDKLRNDDTCTPRPPGADNPTPAVSQTHGSQGPGIDEYRVMLSGGFAHPSHPASTDQGKHQQPMINYGPAAGQQRSSAMLASQVPHPPVPNQPLSAGHSSTLLSNHASAHVPHLGQPINSTESFQPTMLNQPQGSDIQFGTTGRNFQPQSFAPPGPYNQGHQPPFHAGASRAGGPQFVGPPPGDMCSRMTPNLAPHAPESFGLQDERFRSFQAPGKLNIDRKEFEDDLKKFPRLPLDAEPVSQFGNYSLGPREAGKRPVGFHDDAIRKSGSSFHSGYFGLGPGYGRHHVDGMAPRSPISEYSEMPSRRLGALFGGPDDFDGRASRHFGESVGVAHRDSRFPHLPSHLHRDEFEGFGNFRMGEHPRTGDFIGRDEFAGRFRRSEHLGPHDFPRHLPIGDPIGFGAHPGHMRAVELSSGPRSFESFSKGNRPGHPQLGEPGFRSSFSLPGFPNDAGLLTGDIRSFDNLRRRKAASMGWCRICKVDCETVEGLDLHSQTREHQKMAMDIVRSIKQNVKKQKLTPSEQSSVEDGNKSRNTVFEGHGK